MIQKEFNFEQGNFEQWINDNKDVEHLILSGTITNNGYNTIERLNILGADFNIIILDMGSCDCMESDWRYSSGFKSVCKKLIFPQGIRWFYPQFEWFGVLEEVVLPNSTKLVGGFAFYENPIKKIHLPPMLETIEYNAFGGTDIEVVEIPDSCTNVDTGAFADCDKLRLIKVSENHPTYKTICGSLFSKDGKTLICPICCNKDFVVPQGTEYVSEESFWTLNFTSITFPKTIKKIEPTQFDSMEMLRDLYIDKSLSGLFESDSFLNFGNEVKIHLL